MACRQNQGRRQSMKQERTKVHYTVIDPNTPDELQKLLKAVIVEKLLDAKAEK